MILLLIFTVCLLIDYSLGQNQLTFKVTFIPDDDVRGISENGIIIDLNSYYFNTTSTRTYTGNKGDVFTFTVRNNGRGPVGLWAVFEEEGIKYPIVPPFTGWGPTDISNVITKKSALILDGLGLNFLGIIMDKQPVFLTKGLLASMRLEYAMNHAALVMIMIR